MQDTCMEKLHMIRERAIDLLHEEMSRDVDQIDTKEAYDVMDIIKDSFEAEKYYHEGLYYKAVMESKYPADITIADMAK